MLILSHIQKPNKIQTKDTFVSFITPVTKYLTGYRNFLCYLHTYFILLQTRKQLCYVTLNKLHFCISKPKDEVSIFALFDVGQMFRIIKIRIVYKQQQSEISKNKRIHVQYETYRKISQNNKQQYINTILVQMFPLFWFRRIQFIFIYVSRSDIR